PNHTPVRSGRADAGCAVPRYHHAPTLGGTLRDCCPPRCAWAGRVTTKTETASSTSSTRIRTLCLFVAILLIGIQNSRRRRCFPIPYIGRPSDRRTAAACDPPGHARNVTR